VGIGIGHGGDTDFVGVIGFCSLVAWQGTGGWISHGGVGEVVFVTQCVGGCM